MISVHKARQYLLAETSVKRIETVNLWDSCHRVLAEDIYATRSQPPFDASAMDGYAVRSEDAKPGHVLQVIGEAPAGSPFTGTVKPGECVRLFTGSLIPVGADHIVIQEDMEREGHTAKIIADQKPPRHIRKAGIDFKKDSKLLSAGLVLNGRHASLLAAAGLSEIPVHKKPSVAIFANGDELFEIGEDAGAAGIYSSTPLALMDWIRSWGGEPAYLGIAQDNPESLDMIISKAKTHDIIVPLGGASVGDYDLVKSAFETRGYEPVFSKIAIKPGKPTWYGRLDGAHVLGLPGNPASGLVCAQIFLKPLVQKMSGLAPSDNLPLKPVRLTQALSSNGSRELFSRARAKLGEDGQFWATPFPKQDSSLLTPFATANCLIYQPAHHPGTEKGQLTDIMWMETGDV